MKTKLSILTILLLAPLPALHAADASQSTNPKATLPMTANAESARLLEPTRRLIDFLTQRDGMVISGAVSEQECWHDTQNGTCWLGETCAGVYLVQWLDELLRLDRDSVRGDLMERIIYNTLFAAQSPDGRHIRYYTAFEGRRSYYKGDTYCCPNNYRRAIALLPQLLAVLGGKLLGVSDFAPAKPDASLELTEFIDGGQPDGVAKSWAMEERDGPQATYFRVPNLSDARFEEDELLGRGAKTTQGATP